jgi:hypothetical protein
MTVVAVPEAEATRPRTETLVLLWRIEQFHRLGFGEADSWELACSDADLGVARRLHGAGCSTDVALRILG